MQLLLLRKLWFVNNENLKCERGSSKPSSEANLMENASTDSPDKVISPQHKSLTTKSVGTRIYILIVGFPEVRMELTFLCDLLANCY
jgi:hypothetical protein